MDIFQRGRDAIAASAKWVDQAQRLRKASGQAREARMAIDAIGREQDDEARRVAGGTPAAPPPPEPFRPTGPGRLAIQLVRVFETTDAAQEGLAAYFDAPYFLGGRVLAEPSPRFQAFFEPNRNEAPRGPAHLEPSLETVLVPEDLWEVLAEGAQRRFEIRNRWLKF